MKKNVISVPGRDVPVLADADVVVAGGGPSGFAAAVTAARAGLQVILIERYGFLGGLATTSAVGSLCGLYLHHPDRIEPIIRGFATELTDALACRGRRLRAHHPPGRIYSTPLQPLAPEAPLRRLDREGKKHRPAAPQHSRRCRCVRRRYPGAFDCRPRRS